METPDNSGILEIIRTMPRRFRAAYLCWICVVALFGFIASPHLFPKRGKESPLEDFWPFSEQEVAAFDITELVAYAILPFLVYLVWLGLLPSKNRESCQKWCRRAWAGILGHGRSADWKLTPYHLWCYRCNAAVEVSAGQLESGTHYCPQCSEALTYDDLAREPLSSAVAEDAVPTSRVLRWLRWTGRASVRQYAVWALLPSYLFLGLLSFFNLRGVLLALTIAFALYFLTVGISLTVRRLHDRSRSGIWILLLLVVPFGQDPFRLFMQDKLMVGSLILHFVQAIIGTLFLFSLLLIPGDRFTNRYGPPPSRGLLPD